MAKAYLIGGAPRTGKTTLAVRVVKEKPMLAASTDAMRYTLRRIIKEIDEPDLFSFAKFTSDEPEQRDYLKNNPTSTIIDTQNKESAIVWRSVKDFINSNIEDGFDILVEGIAILPELISELDCEYSALFMGNQSQQHYQTILSMARSNPNSPMYSMEDQTIEALAALDLSFSSYIEQSAKEHGFPYVDVYDGLFESGIAQALSTMLYSS